MVVLSEEGVGSLGALLRISAQMVCRFEAERFLDCGQAEWQVPCRTGPARGHAPIESIKAAKVVFPDPTIPNTQTNSTRELIGESVSATRSLSARRYRARSRRTSQGATVLVVPSAETV